jgi:hypothetical protein
MGAISAKALLGLPVRVRGIMVAHPRELLLDASEWRALGFEVVCRDGPKRFLPFATVTVRDDQLSVRSPLLLLDELDFYRSRSRPLTSLLGSPVHAGDDATELRDVLVEPDGTVSELVVGAAGRERRVPSTGASLRRAAA